MKHACSNIMMFILSIVLCRSVKHVSAINRQKPDGDLAQLYIALLKLI